MTRSQQRHVEQISFGSSLSGPATPKIARVEGSRNAIFAARRQHSSLSPFFSRNAASGPSNFSSPVKAAATSSPLRATVSFSPSFPLRLSSLSAAAAKSRRVGTAPSSILSVASPSALGSSAP